jgi:maltose phosphorylase
VAEPHLSVHPWRVIEKNPARETREVAESIFSLANETMGVRGTFEEGSSSHTLEGCYLGGIYGRGRIPYAWQRPGFPSYRHFMVHMTNWLGIAIEVNGERFDMDRSEIAEYERALDMQAGELTRTLTWNPTGGGRLRLRWRRFLSQDDPHVGVIRLDLEALDGAVEATLHFTLDASVGNQRMAADERHVEVLRASPRERGGSLLTKVVRTGQYCLHRMEIRCPGAPPPAGAAEPYAAGIRWNEVVRVAPGRPLAFDKVVTVWTSRDAGYPHGLLPEKRDPDGYSVKADQERDVLEAIEARSEGHAAEISARSGDALRDAHAAALERRWETCDVEIEGDDRAQQGIRYAIFQLLNTYTGRDAWLNIGAKGLTGEIYQGRTFWDTESYCFPFYLLTQPDAARNLLEFRYRGLDAARARARELDYPGAVYPFTTLDGTEDTEVNDYSMTEVHINAIIPYAILLHADVTGSDEYLFGKGIDVLVEQCRFWAARAAYIPYRGGYGINGVTGPDESAKWVNNNFYTNAMAAWVLERVAATLARMKADAPAHYDAAVRRLLLREEETAAWRTVAAGMLLPRDETLGIYPQDDAFLSRDPMRREDLVPDRDLPIERRWTMEKIARVQLCKQPDVLLLMFLHRDRFSREDKEANYRFYEPRTAHGSSLSPAIHSILACDIGDREQAYDYYLYASRLDLDNRNRNTEEGLHTSAMAGTWLNLVAGFAGLRYDRGDLRLNPNLPDGWSSLSFRLRYRGSTLRITVRADHVDTQAVEGPGAEIRIRDRLVLVQPTAQSTPLQPDLT